MCKETPVYEGPEGRVIKQEGLGFTQYLAVRERGTKGRYYDTSKGALNWLRRHYAVSAARHAERANA